MANPIVPPAPNRNNSRVSTPFSTTNKRSRGIPLFLNILKAVLPMLLLLKVRKVVIDEIQKVLSCRNPKNGCLYYCEHCDNFRYEPFTCKSRFCPSCGNLYNKQRASSIGEHLLYVPHRHIIFTIPEQLRPYFLKNRKLLDVLFKASYKTFEDVISETWKGNAHVGCVCTLHTFSRASTWNPHIHVIATEGLFSDWGQWYPRQFISYERLRHVWQDNLLSMLAKQIGPSFHEMDTFLRAEYPDGFYVSAGKTPRHYNGNVKQLVTYVARYLGRPCISTNRIDSFDGKTVKFHYMAHVGNHEERRDEEPSVLDFVLRLIDHIQEPNFRNLRYYGIYSTTGKSSECVQKALEKGTTYLYDPNCHAERHYFSRWRGAMKRSFGYDPIICPTCGDVMEPLLYKINGKVCFSISPRGKKKPLLHEQEELTG